MSSITNPESVGMSPARLARIQPAMQAWIDRGTLAGVSTMLARSGKIVHFEQAGRLDRESGVPLGPDAIFRIFSMTKPIICTALMTLFEEGRVQLFTPVAKYIPAMAGLKVLEQGEEGGVTEVELQRPITVGDLMTHMSGLTYDFLTDSPAAEMYRQARLAADAGRTLQEFVRELTRLPLAFQPGSVWHYSLGIDVAAHLIEIIADRPLRQFLRERIFAPLGMADTDFGVPPEKRARLAATYGVGDLFQPGMTMLRMFAAWQQGANTRIDAEATYPVGHPDTFQRGGHGLFSTSPDYMRFAQMLLNNGVLDGERILGRKTLELMHANRVPRALLPWGIAGVPTLGYGFGLGSRTMMDVGAAGIPGSQGEFGWAGAAKTYYWVDPREEMVGLFMAQYQGMDLPHLDFRVLAYQAIAD